MTTFSRMTGVEDVEKMLAQLPEANAKRVVRNALNAGARVIRDQAKANLTAHGSVDTGALRNTLVIYKKQGGVASMTVALRASGKLYMVVRGGRSKVTRARPSKYAHLVEYGTEHSKAEPFFRPAVATKKDDAVRAIADGAAKSLVREALKLGANARLK